jgi:hypothetical protein
MIENRHQDESNNPELDQDLRLGLTHKRVAKDLTPVHLCEARFERSHDRGFTLFQRLRKLRAPDALPIPRACQGVSTTGRNPSEYCKWKNEPTTALAAVPENPLFQSFATSAKSHQESEPGQ